MMEAMMTRLFHRGVSSCNSLFSIASIKLPPHSLYTHTQKSNNPLLRTSPSGRWL